MSVMKTITTKEQLEEALESHSWLTTPNTDITCVDNFIKITYDESAYRPQLNLHFYNDQGEPCKLTTTQATMFLTICVSMEWNNALVGKTTWRGIDVRKALQIQDEEPSKYANFWSTIWRLFPANGAHNLVTNPLFKSIVSSSANGWHDPMRNFLGSKACSKLLNFDTEKHYEKVNFDMPDQTNDFLEAQNTLIYRTVINERNKRTSTYVDRAINSAVTTKRLKDQFGYKFSEEVYNLETSFYDESAFEIAKLFAPDWWASLEEIISKIVPGSQSEMLVIADEFSNPLCRTRLYKTNAVKSFNFFLIEAGLNSESQEFTPFELQKRISDFVSKTQNCFYDFEIEVWENDKVNNIEKTPVKLAEHQLKDFYNQRLRELDRLLLDDRDIYSQLLIWKEKTKKIEEKSTVTHEDNNYNDDNSYENYDYSSDGGYDYNNDPGNVDWEISKETESEMDAAFARLRAKHMAEVKKKTPEEEDAQMEELFGYAHTQEWKDRLEGKGKTMTIAERRANNECYWEETNRGDADIDIPLEF